ncbi:acyl carrier protein [Spirillospora sp. NPDC048911]|uniref:acyl carrier protein n=1 Tax=Spirillospora sp. NPDC048911 TaxID=3364527 RepID=UPI003710BFD6
MATVEQITDLMRTRLSRVREAGLVLTEHTTFEELGVTSLELANFVFGLEDAFDVELDPSMAAEIRTIGALVRVLNESARVGRPAPESEPGAHR